MGKQNEGSNISTVSLVRCQNYDNSNVEAAIGKALELIGGIESYVEPGDRVLLKINLLTGDVPEKAVTTHPEIVRAMIHQVKSAGGIPQVGDCSGYEGASNRKRYFAACLSSGIQQVCEEEEVEILHLSAESIDVKNPGGRIFKSFILSQLVLQTDVLISLPKLKTHGLTLFTGGVKNNFGCVTGLNKAKMHLQDVLLPFPEKLYVQKYQEQVPEEAVTPELCAPCNIARSSLAQFSS